MRPPSRALLLDLDGVLRRWEEQDAAAADLERRYGLAPGEIARTAFAAERLRPALTGQWPDERWRLEVARALLPACGADTAEVVAAWSAHAGRVDRDVLALVRTVRAGGAPVVLVCNATSRLEDDLVRLRLAGEVDAVVSSARLGAAKPDPRVYAAAAAAAGVPAQDCLYVDDAPGYVAAAEQAGMAGHLYRDPLGLAAVLLERGLAARP